MTNNPYFDDNGDGNGDGDADDNDIMMMMKKMACIDRKRYRILSIFSTFRWNSVLC